jgi:hypothetical protein
MQPVKKSIVHKNQSILQLDLQTIHWCGRSVHLSSSESKASP